MSLNIYEMSEFPILAKAKNISKIPSIDINGTRIEGGLEEDALCSHIQKIASGNKDIILKLDNPSMPYISEDEAKKMQAEQKEQSNKPSASIWQIRSLMQQSIQSQAINVQRVWS